MNVITSPDTVGTFVLPRRPLPRALKFVPPLKLRRHADSGGAKGNLGRGQILQLVSSFIRG